MRSTVKARVMVEQCRLHSHFAPYVSNMLQEMRKLLYKITAKGD